MISAELLQDEQATAPSTDAPTIPTYPRWQALGISAYEAQRLPNWNHSHLGHNLAANFRGLSYGQKAAKFEEAYLSWRENSTALAQAVEALAMLEAPPTYPVPVGANNLFDSLKESVSGARDFKERQEMLSIAKERAGKLRRTAERLRRDVVYLALIADHLDEAKPLQAHQAEFNKLAVKMRALIEKTEALIPQGEASVSHLLEGGQYLRLRSNFRHYQVHLLEFAGDASQGFELKKVSLADNI